MSEITLIHMCKTIGTKNVQRNQRISRLREIVNKSVNI